MTFLSGAHHLVGILHEPLISAAPRRGVLFLSQGIQPKAGSARSYVRLARYLAARGFWAFRFDFPGLGDSEGELPECHLEGFAPEVTRAVTTAAIHTFCQEARLEDIVLYGLCAGARTALQAASVDERVTGLALLGLPLVRAVKVGEPLGMLDVEGYLRKARHWAHWKRLLTFQSDSRYFRNALWRLVRGRAAEQAVVDASVARSVLQILERGQRLLFLYGDRDPFYKMFEVGLHPSLSRLNGGSRVDWTLRVIPDASHAFPQAAAQERLMEETMGWLMSRDPVGAD